MLSFLPSLRGFPHPDELEACSDLAKGLVGGEKEICQQPMFALCRNPDMNRVNFMTDCSRQCTVKHISYFEKGGSVDKKSFFTMFSE